MPFTHELKIFQTHPRLYEAIVGDLIRKFPRGDVMIDGGAHVGEHTANMLRRRDVTHVFAVEAIPELVQGLTKRFGADTRAVILNTAIGKSSGQVSFQIAKGAMGYSGVRARNIPGVDEWEAIDVPLQTLDGLIPEDLQSQVSLIKLDVEGNEFDVMRGAIRILRASRPFVVFENGLREPASALGYDWDDVQAFLDYSEYEFFDFFGNRVDAAYWRAPLQTYMFIGVARTGDNRRWMEAILPAMTAARCAEIQAAAVAEPSTTTAAAPPIEPGPASSSPAAVLPPGQTDSA